MANEIRDKEMETVETLEIMVQPAVRACGIIIDPTRAYRPERHLYFYVREVLSHDMLYDNACLRNTLLTVLPSHEVAQIKMEKKSRMAARARERQELRA